MKQNIALIGLGKYAKYIYLPYIKQGNINLSFIVDLDTKKEEVLSYLEKQGFSNVRFFGITKSSINAKHLDKEFATQLKAICNLLEITHFIVSTDIKAHYRYIEFALKNKIPVLCDKTLVLANSRRNKIHTFTTTRQYKQLLKLEKKMNTNCYFLNETEYNPIYIYAKKVLNSYIKEFQLPITYIDIYESDGEWKLPHEFCNRNINGKLFQNGYSYLYLLSGFIKMNQQLSSLKKIVRGKIHTDKFTLKDELSYMTKDDYKRIFKNQNIPDEYLNKKKFKVKYNSEDNFYSTIHFKNSKGQTITHVNMNLLHYGLSNRSAIDSEANYERNHQEKIHIILGTLLDMKITGTINDDGKAEMDLTIACNEALIDKKEIEASYSKELYDDEDKKYTVEKPVKEYLTRFLNNKDLKGNLEDHALSMEILRAGVKSMQSRVFNTRRIHVVKSNPSLSVENLKPFSYLENVDEDKKLLNTKIRKLNDDVCGVVINRLKFKKEYEIYYYYDNGEDVASELCYKKTKSKLIANIIYFWYSKIANPKKKLQELMKK